MNGTRTTRTRTIRKEVAERKRRFRMALASAGLSMRQWADKEDLSHSHVSQVLNGKRESEKLTLKIDQFAAKQLATAA